MNRSGGDGRLGTGCVIALAIVGFLIFVALMRVLWYPPHVFAGDFGDLVLPNWGLFFRPYGLMSIWGLIQIALAVWVGVDANRKGLNGVLWALLVFFTGVIGLIVYLLVGPSLGSRNGGATTTVAAPPSAPAAATSPPAPAAAGDRCPGCRAELQDEFKVCPYCRAPLRCRQCDRALKAGWKVCPYCTTQIDAAPGGGSA